MFSINKISRKLGFLCIVFFSIVVSTQAQTALLFDGSSSYVEIPYAAANNPAQFTVEFWARVDGGTDYRAPLSSRQGGPPYNGYNFYAMPGDTWQFSGGSGVWEQFPGPAVVIGQWTHLAATYDGASYRFYVDGILVGTPLEAGFSPNTARPMRFGAGNTESTTPKYYFPGAVDEVKIWNYARSASQINDNKYVNLAVPQAGLVSYFQFDGGTATSKTGSTAGVLKNSPTTVNGVIPSAPTGISGTSSICAGDTTTLSSSGGTTGPNVIDVWYSGAFDEAFSEGWETQPYVTRNTVVNSNVDGILNVTSTSADPRIDMFSLGAFDPSLYKYINFRYRVVSGTADSAQLFFLNGTMTGASGAKWLGTPLISDNSWHIATIDMSSHSLWESGGDITGFRFDYTMASGVTMDIDFIQFGKSPIVGNGTSLSVAPTISTTYSVNRKGPDVNTTAISQLVTVNPLPIPTFTAQPGASATLNTDVTYTTQAGQTNYIWSIPGVLNTDYSITSGGTTGDNSLTLKYLTEGSKSLSVNYTNGNACTASSPTTSSSTFIARPFVTTWQTDGTNSVTIPLTGAGYDFTIDWGDGTQEIKTGTPGNISHTYSAAGIKTVSIIPNITTGFPRIYVNNDNALKSYLLTVENWGSGQWGANVVRSFYGANNLEVNATDVPDFSATTNFQYMFLNCTSVTGTNGFTNWSLNTNPAVSVSFSNMFKGATQFNGAISNWDVSRVHTFDYMFSNAINFSQDISSWNVGNATNMTFMFENADAFNIDISGWNVSNVTNMTHMFAYTNLFNQDLNTWDVSSVLNFNQMFKGAGGFNGDISGWNFSTAPSNNITMSYMFQSSNFNRNINTWNVSRVTSMNGMFYQAQTFNQDLSGWDVSSVTTMAGMFMGAMVFNSSLNWGVKTANVTDMSSMFQSATVFNQNIDGWDLSKVTTTSRMFYLATSFNQDLNSWDVTRVTNAGQMFRLATAFNGNISSWRFTTDLTKYISMASIFADASSFNQDLSAWNVERVNQMQRMFQGTPFNQDISAWDISNVANFQLFLSGGKLSRENYDALLLGWSTLDSGESLVPINLNAHFGSSKYSNETSVLTARNTTLIANKNWTITDGGMDDDVVLPEIVGHVLAADNASLSVSFSENVYRTDLGKGTLEITDFLFSLSGGTATLNTTIPTSISTSDNLTFVLGIGIDGTPNGAEALTVTPVLDAIFDVSGNAATTSQNNNTIQLIDSTAPVITGPGSETGGNSVLTMNENTTAVHTFSADGMVTWSLGSSNDEALFGMDSSGNLVFTTAPDYETPSSILNSNTYVVEVIATDAANNSTTQSLSITVADIPKTTFGTFSPINKQYFAGPYTIVPPTTNNSNPIVYTSDNTAVATLSGSVITFTGVGTATITATQAADANYEGNSISTLLTVLGKNLVSKYGGISSTDVNFVNANGSIGGNLGLNKNGAVQDPYENLVTSGLIMHLDAGNTASYSGTGSIWSDLSGNGNHGTLVNNPLYNSSNGGNLVFNGSNNYINSPLTKTTSCSFSVWAKSTNTNSGNMLFNAGNNGVGPDLFFDNGILSWNTWDSSNNPFGSIPASSSDGNWHNYVVVNDAVSNTAKLYYDGVLYGTAVYKDASVSTSLYIGGTTNTYMWNGAIGNFQVHNIALTSLEVDQNFNSLKSIYGL